jgi:N-carbamoylputrescine amidase
MTQLTVAALQLALHAPDAQTNIAAVGALIEEAAKAGAQVVLPPELFAGPYFCTVEDEALFALAHPLDEDPSVKAMQALAKGYGIAIPTSFFERDGLVNGKWDPIADLLEGADSVAKTAGGLAYVEGK